MMIEWNFNEKAFEKAIIGIKQQDASDDYLGNLRIGHLSFDLKLMDYEDTTTGVVLDGDLYIGGVDTGYANTLTNNLPYSDADGIQVLNMKNVDKFKTFVEFKRYLVKKAINFINKSKNEVFIEKMNMDNIFNWA